MCLDKMSYSRTRACAKLSHRCTINRRGHKAMRARNYARIFMMLPPSANMRRRQMRQCAGRPRVPSAIALGNEPSKLVYVCFICRSHACHDVKPALWLWSSIQKAATRCQLTTTSRSCLPSFLSGPPAPSHQAGIARTQGCGPAQRKRSENTRVKHDGERETLASLLHMTRFAMFPQTLRRLNFVRVLAMQGTSYATERCHQGFRARATNINVLCWSCAAARARTSTTSTKLCSSFTLCTHAQTAVPSDRRNCLAFSSSRSSSFCFSWIVGAHVPIMYSCIRLEATHITRTTTFKQNQPIPARHHGTHMQRLPHQTAVHAFSSHLDSLGCAEPKQLDRARGSRNDENPTGKHPVFPRKISNAVDARQEKTCAMESIPNVLLNENMRGLVTGRLKIAGQ